MLANEKDSCMSAYQHNTQSSSSSNFLNEMGNSFKSAML